LGSGTRWNVRRGAASRRDPTVAHPVPSCSAEVGRSSTVLQNAASAAGSAQSMVMPLSRPMPLHAAISGRRVASGEAEQQEAAQQEGQAMGELDLVTLGSVDVEPASLEGPGVPLAELPVTDDVDDTIPPELRGELPGEGWRRVHEVRPRHDRWTQTTFAAPRDGGWALLCLVIRSDGRSILSGDIGPVVPRPGRPARRAGLSLRWDHGRALAALASDPATLTITLTNDTDHAWTADLLDSASVHAGLLAADGTLRQGWFAYAPLRHRLEDLGPHRSRELPVQLSEGALDVPPGSYRLVAWLPALDLRSDELGLTLPVRRV
jgi:hypothetical protein